jgi:DNA polymerase III delta subunit
MIILLYGPDSYRRTQKLGEIVGKYRDRYSGLSYERFDFEENGEALEALKNFSANRSIFDPVRLAVLDQPFSRGVGKELKAILKANEKNKDLVIIINSAAKPPTAFSFLLKTAAKVQAFALPKEENLTAFIKKTAALYDLKLDQPMLDFLVENFGSDTWGLATELAQMSLATNHLQLAPSLRRSPSLSRLAKNYYQLINLLKFSDKTKEKLVALELMLSERRDEPARIFNSLAYRLTSVEEAALLADYDVAVKSGKLDYEEVLLDLALS